MIRLLSVVVTGPLERYAEGVLESLLLRKYAPLSARNLLLVFAHLSRWLATRHLDVRALTSTRVSSFLRSRRRAGYVGHCGPRALDPMLDHLRSIGVVSAEPVIGPGTPLERILVRYTDYLEHERALARSTIWQRVDTARRLLGRDARRATIRALSAGAISAFHRRMSRTHSPRGLACVGSNLRCFLRFLFVQGFVGRDLSQAVPSSVGWRDRTLPRGISATDLRRMLSSCDRRTLVGKRDFAILVLLARLGLRQCEVCALTLDAFDWQRGQLTVHGKGRKRAQLPVPDDVGRAVSSYLLRRPRVADRRVFLRVRAPYRPLRVLGAPVLAASRRAGIAPVRPHRLRHTAATEMLRGGASLGEIAAVLRHSSTATTAIYAKVDRRSLRSLVQPWPGARS